MTECDISKIHINSSFLRYIFLLITERTGKWSTNKLLTNT